MYDHIIFLIKIFKKSSRHLGSINQPTLRNKCHTPMHFCRFSCQELWHLTYESSQTQDPRPIPPTAL